MDNKKLSQLMMELYTNPELKEEFFANPKKVLAQKNIEFPNDLEIKVLEQTKTKKYIVLPHLNDDSDTFTEDLEKKINKAGWI